MLHVASKNEQVTIGPKVLLRLTTRQYKVLKLSEITYIRADSNDSRIHTTSGKTYRSGHGLVDLEPLLQPYGFLRCHRAYLVNTDHINRLEPRNAREMAVVLKGKRNVRLPVNRSNSDLRRDFLWI